MAEYPEVAAYFKEKTGIEHTSDLFRDWSDSTTDIYHAHLLSAGRAVTIDYEGYGLMRFGANGSVYLKVWYDRKLAQVAFVPIGLLFAAMDEPGVTHRMKWHNETGVTATLYSDRLNIVEYRETSDGEIYDERYTVLAIDEFKFLMERLEPLRGYEVPEEWE